MKECAVREDRFAKWTRYRPSYCARLIFVIGKQQIKYVIFTRNNMEIKGDSLHAEENL